MTFHVNPGVSVQSVPVLYISEPVITPDVSTSVRVVRAVTPAPAATQLGTPAANVSTSPLVPTASLDNVFAPDAYSTSPVVNVV